MIRAVKYLALAVIVLGALAAAVMAFVPADRFRQPIETAVLSATDRPLSIAGAMRFVFSPGLGIELTDIAFGGEGEEAMIRAGRAVLDVELLPLLSGEVKVTRLTLDGAEIRLRRDEAGRANWQFEEGGPMRAADPAPSDVMADLGFGDIALVNGRVLYEDRRSGETAALKDVDLRIRWPRAADTLTIAGNITLAGEAIAIDALLEDPRPALQGGRLPLRLDFKSALAAGTIDGEAELDTMVLEGGLTLSAPSARRLAAWLGVAVPGDRGFGRLSIAAAARLTRGRVELHDAKLSLDAMAGSGDLTITMAGDRPSLSGSLAIDAFDSYAYVAPQEPDGSADDEAGWSVAAIDLSGLSGFDANLALRIRRGVFAGLRFENAQGALTVKEGRADLTIDSATLYGGVAKGRVGAGTKNGKPALSVAVTLAGMDGQSFLADAIEIATLTGRTDLVLDLAATGVARAQRMATLVGTARLSLTSGTLDGADVEAIARSIAVGGPIVGVGGESATNFTSFSVDFRIEGGVARTQTLRIAGPGLTVAGAGAFEMAGRLMRLTLTPEVADPAATPYAAFAVVGPWSGPVYLPEGSRVPALPRID